MVAPGLFSLLPMHASIEPTVAALTTLESVLPTHPDMEAVSTLRRVLSTWRGAMDAQCLRDLEAVLTPAFQAQLERVVMHPSVVGLPEEHRILAIYVETCAGILARNQAVATVRAEVRSVEAQLERLTQTVPNG